MSNVELFANELDRLAGELWLNRANIACWKLPAMQCETVGACLGPEPCLLDLAADELPAANKAELSRRFARLRGLAVELDGHAKRIGDYGPLDVNLIVPFVETARQDAKWLRCCQPDDLITTVVAIQGFEVARATLMRALEDGEIRSYRKDDAPPNTQHVFSESALARRYKRRGGRVTT